MKWEGIIPLESENNIKEFEEWMGYTLPKDFKEFVLKNNGGEPEEIMCFDTEKEPERVFDYFFSFNHEKNGISVWNAQGWDDDDVGLTERYVTFAGDVFGNDICFDRTNDNVVFVNHETYEVEFIAKTFTEFIESLYEDEDDGDK